MDKLDAVAEIINSALQSPVEMDLIVSGLILMFYSIYSLQSKNRRKDRNEASQSDKKPLSLKVGSILVSVGLILYLNLVPVLLFIFGLCIAWIIIDIEKLDEKGWSIIKNTKSSKQISDLICRIKGIKANRRKRIFSLIVSAVFVVSGATIFFFPKNVTPEEAVRSYYQLINRHDYNIAWDRLSTDFKDSQNQSSKSDFGFNDYQGWWNKVKQVDILYTKLEEQADNRAVVVAKLKYIFVDKEKKSLEEIYRYYLILNNSNHNWLIDQTKTVTL